MMTIEGRFSITDPSAHLWSRNVDTPVLIPINFYAYSCCYKFQFLSKSPSSRAGKREMRELVTHFRFNKPD